VANEPESPFDLMIRFGPLPPRGSGLIDIASVQAALERQRVHGAVVASNRAIMCDVAAGNGQVAEAAKQATSASVIVPGAILDPRTFDGRNPSVPAETRLLYVLPASQRYPLPYAPLRDLLRQMPRTVPLYVEVRHPGDATRIGMLLQDIGYVAGTPGQAPVILGGITGSTLIEALSAAKANSIVGVSTQGMVGIGEIRHAVTVLGAQRVFFASGAPAESLAAAVALLKLAGLSPEERAAVFGANARRMLGIAAPVIE